MADTPRLLLLMRHAQAVNLAPGLGDAERPLSDEGRHQAGRIAKGLADLGITVDRTICSSAVRTRETAKLLQLPAPPDLVDALYNAGSDTIRAALATADPEARTVLVIGHAPGIPSLVEDLADPTASEPDLMHGLSRGFAAATLAGIEIGGTWAAPTPGRVAFVLSG